MSLFRKKKEEKEKSVSYYEEFLLSQMKEYFYIEDISQEYSKISLKYWMRAYLILKKDVENNLNIIKQYQSKEEILKLLTKSVTNKNIKKKQYLTVCVSTYFHSFFVGYFAYNRCFLAVFFEYGYGFVGFVGRHRHDHSYTHIEDVEHLVVRYVAISLKEAEYGRNLPAALFDFDTLSFAEYTRDIFVETAACDVAYTVYVAATYDI